MIATAARTRPGATALILPRYRILRLRAIVLSAAGIFALLALSLLSMRVETAHARVIALDRRLAAAQRDYAALTTEYDIRSRPDALLTWGETSLALAPPRVHQYLEGLDQLQTLARPTPSPPQYASR
jgi:hypothetical protein